MSPVNLIYSGGGRFFALLPYMDDGDNSLMEAQRDLDRLLLKHHDGALYLSLGWTHLSMPDFANPDRFSAQWRAVTTATNTAKRAHYRTLPEEELFTAVFEPRSRGRADEFCLRGVERDEIDADEEDARGAISAIGQSFEQFSRRLAHADYLLVSTVTDTPSHPASFDAVLRELGLEVQPVSAKELERSWRSGTTRRCRLCPSAGAAHSARRARAGVPAASVELSGGRHAALHRERHANAQRRRSTRHL